MSQLPETLFERIHVPTLQDEAASQEQQHNRFMLKCAFAALILAPNGDVLVAGHEAKEGEHEQGALGTLMETYRYMPHIGDGMSETPAEVFHRALLEEFKIDDCLYEKAGFFFNRAHPLVHQEWTGGPRGKYADFYAWTTNLIVHVQNPEVLTFEKRISEEILWTEFRPIDSVLKTQEPTRIGYLNWLNRMRRIVSLPVNTTLHAQLEWSVNPNTGKDILHPFTGS